MGVDFYACKACERTFPDCGEYSECSEDSYGCGAIYCSDKCAQIQKPDLEDIADWQEFDKLPEAEQAKRRMSCVDCRLELESDENMLSYLLMRNGQTYEWLRDEYRNWINGKNPAPPAQGVPGAEPKGKGGDPAEPESMHGSA